MCTCQIHANFVGVKFKWQDVNFSLSKMYTAFFPHLIYFTLYLPSTLFFIQWSGIKMLSLLKTNCICIKILMKETPIPSGKYVESNNTGWCVRLHIWWKREKYKFPTLFLSSPSLTWCDFVSMSFEECCSLPLHFPHSLCKSKTNLCSYLVYISNVCLQLAVLYLMKRKKNNCISFHILLI